MEVLRVASVGFALGLSVAAQIGPVSVLCATAAGTRGFRWGACVGLGAVVADMTYAGAGLLVGDAVSDLEALIRVLTLAAGVFLVLLGVTTVRTAAVSRRSPEDPGSAAGLARVVASEFAAFRTGALLTLANVQTIAFWAAVMTGSGAVAAASSAGANASLVAGIGIGTAAWFLAVTTVATVLAGRVSRLWTLQLVGGASLAVFGVVLLARGIR